VLDRLDTQRSEQAACPSGVIGCQAVPGSVTPGGLPVTPSACPKCSGGGSARPDVPGRGVRSAATRRCSLTRDPQVAFWMSGRIQVWSRNGWVGE
jgi:hypothetical protein